MLRIDTRVGSQNLIIPLIALGLPAEGAQLSSGDIEILGNGLGGPILTGVEIKKIPDLIDSIRSGRLAEQLRNMRDSYSIRWLLIEGRMREHEGHLQVRRDCGKWFNQPGKVTYAEIASYVLTMAMRSGILLWRTETQEETVQWIKTLYNWLTTKEWEEHRAHLDIYDPLPPGANPFTGPVPPQEVAFKLPGLGSIRSYSAAKHFKSIRRMINASEKEWAEVDGIGKAGAARLVETIGREYDLP